MPFTAPPDPGLNANNISLMAAEHCLLPHPKGYQDIEWVYLPQTDDPKGDLRARIAKPGNKRVKVLRDLMGIEGIAD